MLNKLGFVGPNSWWQRFFWTSQIYHFFMAEFPSDNASL